MLSKKKGIAVLLLLALTLAVISISVFAKITFIQPESSLEIGDENVLVVDVTGDIDYSRVYDRIVIDFEPLVVQKTIFYERCTSDWTDETHTSNTSLSCVTLNYTVKIRNYSLKGDPIYAQTEKQIVYQTQTYDLEDKGCWTCGDYIACISRKDGYSPNRAEKYKCDVNNYPLLRDGETGFIRNLRSNLPLESQTDGEILK